MAASKQTLITLFNYLTCDDPVMKTKYENILVSFFHKDDGLIITSKVADGNGGTNITFSDESVLNLPVLPASKPIAFIQGLVDALNAKVDTVLGKQLSTEDFTTLLKNKLSTLVNYVHPDFHLISEVRDLQAELDNREPKVAGKGLSANDLTNELLGKITASLIKSIAQHYANATAMIADQINQKAGNIYTADAAGGDPTVLAGAADYEYLGVANGLIADYRKLSEQESMDLTEKVDLTSSQEISGLKTFLYDKLGMRNAANTFTSFFRNTNTAIRYYTLPNRNDTLVGLLDLATYQAKLSGVANYITKSLDASTLTVSRLFDNGTFFGIGTVNAPTKDITLGNQANREIGIELSSSSTVGKDLILSAGKTINYQLSAAFVGLILGNARRYCIKGAPNGDMYFATGGGAYPTDIYVRTNGIGVFSAKGFTGRHYNGITVAPNGDLYVSTAGGDIYIQVGASGALTALAQTSRQWYRMTSGLNGDIYCLIKDSGDIYKRTNGVGDFVALGQISRTWQDIQTHPNGDIYAISGSIIFIQTGGVGDFNSTGVNCNGISFAISPNTNIYSCTNNAIRMQTGGAGSFNLVPDQPLGNWIALASSITGSIYLNGFETDMYVQDNDSVGIENLQGGTLKLKAGTGKGTGQSRVEFIAGKKTVSGTDMQIETVMGYVDENGFFIELFTPIYADNASAVTGGLVVGTRYKTVTGELRIVI